MLTAYLDESGTDGRSPIVAVGGYVSTEELWASFQNEWQSFLDNNGIENFHATDILALRGNFTLDKSWNQKRAQSALRIVDRIIRKYVLYGAVTYTAIADCEKVFPLKHKNGRRDKFSAEYLLSGVQTVNLITAWAEQNGYTEPIKFVFEDGANGRGYLLDATKYAKRGKEPSIRAHLIGGVSLDDKRVVPQLQSADRLIHHTCRTINEFLKDENSVDGEIKKLIESKLVNVHALDAKNFPELVEILKAEGVYERDD